MVTDDRKAEHRLAGRVRLRTSLDLIKSWAERHAIDAATIARMLVDVCDRRSYVPAARHALKTWWDRHVGDR